MGFLEGIQHFFHRYRSSNTIYNNNSMDNTKNHLGYNNKLILKT